MSESPWISPIIEPKKEKGNYVFPKSVGNAMSKISPRTQYEAAMMAMVFIMFGLLASCIFIWFTDLSLFMKIFTVFNALCGFVFLSSFLVTTFQQYQSFLMAMGIMEDKDE